MSESPSQVQTPPTREELNAELLPVPEPPELPPTPEPPGTDKIIEHALGHVRGKRGGDLVAVILTGSGARRALTAHSDLDFIVLVKGHDEGQEIIRIANGFDGKTICALADACAIPIRSYIEKFGDEFERHVRSGTCDVPGHEAASCAGDLHYISAGGH